LACSSTFPERASSHRSERAQNVPTTDKVMKKIMAGVYSLTRSCGVASPSLKTKRCEIIIGTVVSAMLREMVRMPNPVAIWCGRTR
jgi:hypothetical protein